MTIRRGDSIIAGNSADIPSQTGQSGKFLTTNGTTTSWAAVNVDTSDIYNKIDTKQDKSTAVNYNNISNCITEIPQDIKLELNDGTLTLKAGSKVYMPNGAGVFNAITTTSNLYIEPTSGSGKVLVSINSTETFGSVCPINKCVSGAGVTPIDYSLVYDTTTNIITRYGANGSIIYSNSSFPLAVCSQTDGKLTSIDQVFNGFGYIGSTVFALPGVKGLIPNGRNADGSLNNVEVNVSSVSTLTVASTITTPGNGRFLLNQNGGIFAKVGSYDEVNNYVLGGNGIEKLYGCVFADNLTITSGVITSFQPKTAFHAMDLNDLSQTIDNSTTKYPSNAAVVDYSAKRHQVVSVLPVNPDPDTFYYIPEE